MRITVVKEKCNIFVQLQVVLELEVSPVEMQFEVPEV